MKKLLSILLLAVSVCIISVIPALANDYEIQDAYWDYDSYSVIARWEKCESSTSYKVTLLKGEKIIDGPIKSSGSSKDFTSSVISEGTGKYYFVVYPEKGGEDYAVSSSALIVDSTLLKDLKEQRKTEKEIQKSANKLKHATGVQHWESNPGETWSYYLEDGSKVTGWRDIGDHRYLFDKNGLTLYGWQFTNSRWYYLEPKGTAAMPQGALYKNCVTPDGYPVNELGEWVVDGKPVTTDVSKRSVTSPSIKTIKNCSISLSTTVADPGKPNYVEPRSASNAKITDFVFDKPYEDWTSTGDVKVTMHLEANNGYCFDNSTGFSCSNASVISKGSGRGLTRTVTISFTPGAYLATPEGFMVSRDEGLLYWDKVPGAKRYRIVITKNNSKEVSEIISENTFDIGSYISDADDGEAVSIKVTALVSENNKKVKESKAGTINDLGEFLDTNNVNGTFEKSGGKLKYMENDEYVTGWKKIGGYWYHFASNGNASSGWFQDTETGYWYFFDKNSRKMLIGHITDSGTDYFLNDGSIPSLPVGAWVEGYTF